MRKVGWPEPELALQGGVHGTDLLHRLIRQSSRKLRSTGHLLLEAAPRQMPVLQRELADQGFEKITVVTDLAGRDRVIKARR